MNECTTPELCQTPHGVHEEGQSCYGTREEVRRNLGPENELARTTMLTRDSDDEYYFDPIGILHHTRQCPHLRAHGPGMLAEELAAMDWDHVRAEAKESYCTTCLPYPPVRYQGRPTSWFLTLTTTYVRKAL